MPAISALSDGSRKVVARCTSPSARRTSAPCPAMAGSLSGAKNKSSSASGRPLTNASAPPIRLDSRSSATVRSGGTTTSSGVGARSRIVPSTSSKTALEGRVTASINNSRSGIATFSIEYRRRSDADGDTLAGQHFNFPVDAWFHLEFAVVGLALVAGDHRIFAFRQDHLGKGADRFLHDVAAWSQHRPLGICERLAAALIDQLEGDHGGAMVHDDVGQLAGLDPDIGAHRRVGVAVVGNDVIGAFGQQQHVGRADARGDRTLVLALELAAAIDIEGDLARRNTAV